MDVFRARARAVGALLATCTLAACGLLEPPPQVAGPVDPATSTDPAIIASGVDRVATERWPDEFGGLWLDGDDTVVAFTTDPAPKIVELHQAVPRAGQIVGKRVQHSLADLRALQDRLRLDRSSLQQGNPPPDLPDVIVQTGGRYDLDIDVMSNTVIVALARVTPRLRAAFEDHYKSTAMVFEEGVAGPAR